MSLDWRHLQGRWRLCHRERVIEAEICTWLADRPVAECPVDEQVVLAQHLGALRAKMKDEAERRCAQASEAIECLEKALIV